MDRRDVRLRDSLEKVAFALSVVVLAFLYGHATRGFGWFPTEILERAWQQGRVLVPAALGGGRGDVLHEQVYERTGARPLLPARRQPGLTFITSAWEGDGGLRPGLRLIDEDGGVVHEWRFDPAQVFATSPTEKRSVNEADIHGSYLLPDGDVLVNIEYVGTVRLDACSRLLWKLPGGSHHSIARAEDGTFWISAVTSEPRSTSPRYPNGFPGLKSPVYQDRILHVAGDGTPLDTVNVLEVLYENGLAWHLAEERRLNFDDPTHLNDADPLPDSLAPEFPLFEAGDLAVSLRHLDLVLVLDPDTERLKWSSSGPWFYQHDPEWLSGGWIGVFDNRPDGTDRGTMLGGSRIVAVQPHTDSVQVLFPTSRSEPFYTPKRGKWQPLENGNMLLTEAEAARVVEVAPDGSAVWEWVHAPFREGKVPPVTKAVRVDVSRQTAASWPCSFVASGTGGMWAPGSTDGRPRSRAITGPRSW